MIRNLTTGNHNELRLMDVANTLRMVDHGALTKDGIHFNTRPGIQWINDAFQTRIEEMEAELRIMVNPVTRGSPACRVRSYVPQAFVNRLGPLTTEANVVQPSPSSNVRERLTDVRHQVRERAPPNRRGNFLVVNKPNNRHHKMRKQFTKSAAPRQTAGEHSRDYP